MKYKSFAIALLVIVLLGLPLARPGYAQTEPVSRPAPLQQEDTFSVSVSPTSDARTGLPGAVVFYSLTVTNTGTGELNLAVPTPTSLNGWAVSVDPTAFSLSPSDSKVVVVTVAIPGNASSGSMDVTTIHITNQDGGSVMGQAVLTSSAAAPQPTVYARPLIVLNSYSAGSGEIEPGQEFELRLRIANSGQDFARNVVFTFSGTDFLPVGTGGVRAHNEIDPGESLDIVQKLLASTSLLGSRVATTTVNVSYTDLDGTPFTETFTITINLKAPSSSGGSARPTATPTTVSRPQLVVSGYETDVTPLQPGVIFNLKLDVRNLGTMDARSVTMVLGGGVSAMDNGTPVPGGSGSDLSVFAPLGASNVVYLGDIPLGGTVQSSQQLIVNVTANPGAYAFKLSFVYDDAKGNRQVNDQVITMLIYQLPQVEVGFYRDPGVFFVGQPNILPLQVTNLGRKTSVLGNMKVTAANADITNNTTLVGILDPGGYFTLDANAFPMQPGPLTLEITVSYTDDFNQPRVINQTLNVEVMDVPTPEPVVPGENGFPPDGMPTAPETFWQKVVRFFKGLLGLDSAPAEQNIPLDGFPGEVIPDQVEPEVRPVVPPKG